jgi:hypothetical protein
LLKISLLRGTHGLLEREREIGEFTDVSNLAHIIKRICRNTTNRSQNSENLASKLIINLDVANMNCDSKEFKKFGRFA